MKHSSVDFDLAFGPRTCLEYTQDKHPPIQTVLMRNTALPVILLLTLSRAAIAGPQISIAPSLLHFDYTEFGSRGNELDNETGWLPGVQLLLETGRHPPWSAGLELSVYSGTIDYTGQTQTGTPHATTTKEMLVKLGTHISTPLARHTRLVFAANFNEWERDINDSNGVSGLLEIYSWWEISAGATLEFWNKDDQSWQAGVFLIRTIDPGIHIDLSRANFGSTDLDLGAEWGSRLQLAWTQYKDAGSHVSIKLYHEARDFGQSGTGATTGGASSLFVMEPRSESRHTGIQFLAGFNY